MSLITLKTAPTTRPVPTEVHRIPHHALIDGKPLTRRRLRESERRLFSDTVRYEVYRAQVAR